MLGIKLADLVKNTDIGKRTKIQDIIERITKLK